MLPVTQVGHLKMEAELDSSVTLLLYLICVS